jgi:carbon storage regulator
MLVLSRSIGQKIVIGDDITVCVVGVDGRSGQVKLGIEAPKDIQVDRLEVRIDRLTHPRQDLTVLRDIYFWGVEDRNDNKPYAHKDRWGEQANKAYALGYEEY